MKIEYVVGILIGLIVVAVGIFTITVVPKRIDADAGVIRFPFYQGTPTMDAARDMISALGWEHISESGDGKHVTFRAADQNGKVVTFDFIFNLAGTKVVVSTEEASQYSVKDITKELARRIGMRIDGDRLSEVKLITSGSRGTC